MAILHTLTCMTLVLATGHCMIMRNNALMTKMVSKFQGKENKSQQRQNTQINDQNKNSQEMQDQIAEEHVLSLMQNVLCRNFPSIPCKFITKDNTLKALIEKSIKQIKYKKMSMQQPNQTSPPSYQLTLFPAINSEDLSNFLQVRHTGSFKKKTLKKKSNEKSHWSPQKKKSKKGLSSGRKKMRKYYPHKVKNKDKNEKRGFQYSDEKLSMSVETPRESNAMKKRFSFHAEPSNPPVWRIDYTKHGEPSLNNMFGFEADNLNAKIFKTGPNVIVDDAIMEQAPRKEVLHPDIYIKKSFSRKGGGDNSEPTE